VSAPWRRSDERDGLHEHTEWSGPARYDSNGAAVARLDLPFAATEPVDAGAWDQAVGICDEKEFLPRLLAQLPEWLEGRATPGWEPPEAAQLADWLGHAGHTTAIDEAGSLRAVLKRKGCDGQVLIERKPERLRLTMRIGAWKAVEPNALAAMRELTCAANHRTRLVRLAWLPGTEADHVRCEAQLDLTGLPLPDDEDSSGDAFWSAILSAGIDGLQLHLDRLALELEALADPRNRDVVEILYELQRG